MISLHNVEQVHNVEISPQLLDASIQIKIVPCIFVKLEIGNFAEAETAHVISDSFAHVVAEAALIKNQVENVV